MNGNWAYYWVQVLGHHKAGLSAIWLFISLLVFYGLLDLNMEKVIPELGLLSLSLALMSLTVAYLMASFKTALIQFLLSGYVLLMTLGTLGWLRIDLSVESILGLVVLVTLVTSNLIHTLSALLREMARGVFQFDAVAEAIKLNSSPLFLSNLTTALGFLIAAWFNDELISLATVVLIGAIVSYLTTLSWLPMILSSWLLEFRVGNTADRHGFSFIVPWLLKNRKVTIFIAWFSVLFGISLLIYSGLTWPWISDVFWLVFSFIILFFLFWQSFKLALLTVWINLLALLCTANLMVFFMGAEVVTLVILMIPLGLIVDDGIHFFSRYLRGKPLFLAESSEAVRFAMTSVGRPIWISSWVLVVGLSTLFFSQNELIQLASITTVVALIFSTLLTLVVLPALLVNKNIGES